MSDETPTRDRIHFQDELSWKELDGLPRESTLILMTVAPVQAQGPHLPTGLDGFTSQAFALATAKEFCRRKGDWHAVLAPHLPLGSHTFHMPGAMDMKPSTVRRVVEDQGASFARDGFRYVMVISSHSGPGHVRAIEDACERVSRRFDIDMVAPMGPKIAAFLSGAYDEKLGRLARSTAEHSYAQDIHAGRWATSVALYLRPDLVRPGYTDLPPVLVDPNELGPDTPATAGEGLGYLGSPGQASAELGRGSVEAVARDFTELMFCILRGEDVSERVRTPWEGTDYLYEYSNVAIGALAVIAILLLWALVRLL
jgi:creatinine amidohydrolase